MEWSGENTNFLNVLVDRKGVRLHVLDALSRKNMQLRELSEELAPSWDHSSESLIRHLRPLEKVNLVARDSGKYLCVCPAKTKEFLLTLDNLLEDLASASETLLDKYKRADSHFQKFIIGNKAEQKAMKPALNSEIDTLFLDDGIRWLNGVFVKKWLGRMTLPDLEYDFRRLYGTQT